MRSVWLRGSMRIARGVSIGASIPVTHRAPSRAGAAFSALVVLALALTVGMLIGWWMALP